jgi:hypothetical protein
LHVDFTKYTEKNQYFFFCVSFFLLTTRRIYGKKDLTANGETSNEDLIMSESMVTKVFKAGDDNICMAINITDEAKQKIQDCLEEEIDWNPSVRFGDGTAGDINVYMPDAGDYETCIVEIPLVDSQAQWESWLEIKERYVYYFKIKEGYEETLHELLWDIEREAFGLPRRKNHGKSKDESLF